MTPTGPCSLPPDALEERLASWRALNPSLVGCHRRDGGLGLRYRLDPAVVERLLELIEAERHCCPSLRFDTTALVRIQVPAILAAWWSRPWLPTPADCSGAGAGNWTPRRSMRRCGAHYAVAAGGPGAAPHEAPEIGLRTDVYGPGVLATLPDPVVASSIGCAAGQGGHLPGGPPRPAPGRPAGPRRRGGRVPAGGCPSR